jgi:hypothetical protein
MAATPIWGQVCTHLVAVLTGATELAGVQVLDGWPGDLDMIGPETLVVDDEIDSVASMPVAVGGVKPYDDIFEVRILAHVRGRITRAATRERLAEIEAAVHSVLAADPSLSDLDGVLSAGIVRRRHQIQMTADGALSYAEITLSVHSRLSPY